MEPFQQPFALTRVRQVAFRLALAGLGLTIVFYAAGSFYAGALLPLHAKVLAAIQPRYEIRSLRVVDSAICLDTIVHCQFSDESGSPLRMQRSVPVSLPASSLYIQPIILLALLVAWPGLVWRRRLRVLLQALPLLVAISLVDIPFVLAWEVEDAIAADLPGSLKTIAFAGLEIKTRVQDSQMLTYWYVFLQTGGRQFLALLGFLFCLALAAFTRSPGKAGPAREDRAGSAREPNSLQPTD